MQASEINYSQENISVMLDSEKERDDVMNENKLFKIVMFVYALVMMGSAALILVLFEKVVSFSIYFIYLAAGIILGLSAIILIHLFSKNDQY